MQTGLDRLRAEPGLQRPLRGARVGLLSHPASVTRELTHASEVLSELAVRPAILFGPEHGYGGEDQDMVGVADARDPGGTAVRSLYGDRFEDLSPRPADLAEIDVLVVDLQDVGARYYTFVWTAVLAARACARAGVRVVVLDRPNPLGGDSASVEGQSGERRYLSFVGLEPVPVRHSLTLGELVAWCADEEDLPRDQVSVAAVLGLDRAAHATAWDRPFVPPSPNMPTYDTALVYPGGCLLEGTNVSEGRGTTRPFEVVGAPFVDGARLAKDLDALPLDGFRARPLTFRPTFHKHAGKLCGGVQIHVTDARTFRPFETYLALVALCHRQRPDAFAFRTETYEFRDDVPAFDLLTGGPAAREAILRGEDPATLARCAASLSPHDRDLHARAVEAGRRRAI